MSAIANAAHSRGPYTTDDWITPKWLIDRLGPFDLDPCASERQPWPCALYSFREQDNGLAKRWAGLTCLHCGCYNPIDGYNTENMHQMPSSQACEHGVLSSERSHDERPKQLVPRVCSTEGQGDHGGTACGSSRTRKGTGSPYPTPTEPEGKAIDRKS